MQNRAILQALAGRRHNFFGPALFAEHELAEPDQSGDHQSSDYGNGKKRLKPHGKRPIYERGCVSWKVGHFNASLGGSQC
jgi:hypothetical protein